VARVEVVATVAVQGAEVMVVAQAGVAQAAAALEGVA
jgi:hypothetical protein